jgi:hypothetical protein
VLAHRESYAVTNEAEFFAVAVEAFFERPRLLQRYHAKLYTALVEFFAQDPAAATAPAQDASMQVGHPSHDLRVAFEQGREQQCIPQSTFETRGKHDGPDLARRLRKSLTRCVH